MIIDGKGIGNKILFEAKERLRSLHVKPGLGIVQIGNDPASSLYVSLKERACRELGLAFFHDQLPADTNQQIILSHIHEWNADPNIRGIVVQLPLPKHLDTDTILGAISFEKDVDGLSPAFHDALVAGEPTQWLPALMAGILACVEAADVQFSEDRFLVAAKSQQFTSAFSAVLSYRNASVTTASSVDELRACLSEATVIISLLGIPDTIHEADCAVSSVVIDCGITKTDDGVSGDFAGDEGLGRVRAYTPVPGGVGPVTVAMLVANTVTAAQHTYL